jgi:hypothetical protein
MQRKIFPKYHLSETIVLDLRPRLLGFHMSGPATCPYIQIKRHGEGQRREVYYVAAIGNQHFSSSSAIFGV